MVIAGQACESKEEGKPRGSVTRTDSYMPGAECEACQDEEVIWCVASRTDTYGTNDADEGRVEGIGFREGDVKQDVFLG